jgi:hypothetical protein
LAAAELNPMPSNLSERDAEVLVRASLYNGEKFDELFSADVLEDVDARYIKALQGRLENSNEKFAAWLQGPKSNFATTLARHRRGHPTELTTKQVRSHLLVLGWQAYKHVGRCFDHWVSAFLASALSQLRTGIGGIANLCETAGNTEVFHAEEVHCAAVAFGTQQA